MAGLHSVERFAVRRDQNAESDAADGAPGCDHSILVRATTPDESMDSMSDASVERDSPRSTAPVRLRPSSRSVEIFSALSAPSPRVATRAIVASSLRLLRDGLMDALDKSNAIHVIGTAADAERLRASIRELEPDLVLLDIDMAGSLALVHAVHDFDPSPKVVAFAVSDADDALVEYIEAGIAGYVTRDGSLTDVVATVESVARGETIISPKLAASLFKRLAAQRRREDVIVGDGPPELTSRERQILLLIEQGMANKEIARTLGIELATVKNHVHHVLEKLKVSRRGQAAARARATQKPS
jgi:two-component system nitrate/nitrite response regulator NarL